MSKGNIYDPVFRNANKEELHAIADEIYDDLGLGWKAYPEEKPGESMDYLVTCVGVNEGIYFEMTNVWWGRRWMNKRYKVIAFRKPTPYQP